MRCTSVPALTTYVGRHQIPNLLSHVLAVLNVLLFCIGFGFDLSFACEHQCTVSLASVFEQNRVRPGRKYSGGQHIRFPFGGEGSLWILGFGAPSTPNPPSRAVKSTLPGPWEGSSILNVDLVVVTAVVGSLVALGFRF